MCRGVRQREEQVPRPWGRTQFGALVEYREDAVTAVRGTRKAQEHNEVQREAGARPHGPDKTLNTSPSAMANHQRVLRGVT